MTRDFNDSDIEDEIREAFRMFDKEGNGFITSIDLMEIMTSIGDVLSFEEADVSNAIKPFQKALTLPIYNLGAHSRG